MRVTGPKTWLALGGLFLILGAALVWGYAGTIPTKAGGQGVIVRTGTVLNVVTVGAGLVTSISVNLGDRVKANQVVAKVSDPEMLDKIRLARAAVDEAKAERERNLRMRREGAQLQVAALDEDMKAMPMGMHTVVSEGGGGLSGGQRQRLLIARAIVHKPRVLLFDEATSALDNRTQAIVSRSLKNLNATRVVIAHRLTTVMHADRIYVLDKGSLVEEGTYDELMAQGGLFASLAKRQLS